MPYALSDIQETLVFTGDHVFVQDIVNFGNPIAIIDDIVHANPDIIFTVDVIALPPFHLAFFEPKFEVISWFFDNPAYWLESQRDRTAQVYCVILRTNIIIYLAGTVPNYPTYQTSNK